MEEEDVTKTINTREIVLDVLMEVLEKNKYSHLILNQALKKHQFLDKQDRAFISRISEGTIERLLEIDYIINQFSKVPVHKMKPVIRNILRMAVYEIKYMDSIPVSASCNEAVKLAEKRNFGSLKGFVNGVLRAISRNLSEIKYPDKNVDLVKYLSIWYSIPEWIIVNWMSEYSEEDVEKIAKASLENEKTSVRLVLSKGSREEILKLLEKDKVLVEPSNYLDYAFYISGYDYLNDIQAFREGYLQVQDISSMLVAEAAGVKEGNYIIDVCAAPGGKSLHLADKLHGSGMVEARDLTEYKVSLIQENIQRIGADNITVKQQDALLLDDSSVGKADILIADLPCSGLGVMGRKTDIKYKTSPDNLKELVKLQREILSTVYKYVKVGGTLIYSTCTINKEENEENLKWFTENYPFVTEDVTPYLPDRLSELSGARQGHIQLLPGVHNTDGFFIGRLRRTK